MGEENMPFYIVSLLAYYVIKSVVVILFCGGLGVVRTYWKMPYSACLLSRKVTIKTVRNFAISDMVVLQKHICSFSKEDASLKQALPCFLNKSQNMTLFCLPRLVSVT